MHQHDQHAFATERKRLYGVYPATVTNLADPAEQGRVKVQLAWFPDHNGGSYEVWARLAVLMAGDNRGTWFIPDQGDEVLVAFEAGDPRRPYVVGTLWNGQDRPPERMDQAQDNFRKSIVSRRNIRITFDDHTGQETLTLTTPTQRIVINDGEQSIEIQSATGNTVRLDASGVTISTGAQVTVQAGAVEVSAGMVTVNAGLSKFSGVVQADTVITNAVVSSSYTPGAGNVW